MPAGSGSQWPEDYERGRPGWPSAVADVAAVAATSPVLDLGAGTGKLTRVLLESFPQVIAVEPSGPMGRVLTALSPGADLRDGSATAIPLADRSVGGVFVAEAFHWFDDEPALAEIARVLQPRGALVLMWNVPAHETEPSIADAEQFLAHRRPRQDDVAYPLDLRGPHFASGEWRNVLADSSFEPLREHFLANPQDIDRDGLVAFFASMGWIAEMPDGERLPLLAELRGLLTADRYLRHWETQIYWTTLSSA